MAGAPDARVPQNANRLPSHPILGSARVLGWDLAPYRFSGAYTVMMVQEIDGQEYSFFLRVTGVEEYEGQMMSRTRAREGEADAEDDAEALAEEPARARRRVE